jgi:hypothetical protein
MPSPLTKSFPRPKLFPDCPLLNPRNQGAFLVELNSRARFTMQQRFWPDPQPLVERLGVEFFRSAPESPGIYMMRGKAEAVR